jgi:hypothetical protein
MSPADTPQMFNFVDVWRDNVDRAAIVPINQSEQNCSHGRRRGRIERAHDYRPRWHQCQLGSLPRSVCPQLTTNFRRVPDEAAHPNLTLIHRLSVCNFAQTASVRASKNQVISKRFQSRRNAAAFTRSTKVRIFRFDRHNSDCHGGIVLGFDPHLDNSACGRLVQQPNHCALLLWGT